MKKILAFAGSNSKNSINKHLVTYATSLTSEFNNVVLDLNDYDIPLYSIDVENELGFPKDARRLLETIQSSNGIILSLAEHNGAYSAVFKNVLDWMSRIDKNVWANKPMLLMATSPGARGGKFVLEMAQSRMPILGAHVVEVFSLPSFYDNFSEGTISNLELNQQLIKAVSKFKNAI